MNLLVLSYGWVYIVGDAEFSHSWYDMYAIVLKASHKENYPNQYVVVPLKVDSILCTGTWFLGYMDCELNKIPIVILAKVSDLNVTRTKPL